MIRERQDGEDWVWESYDRHYGGAVTEAVRIDGITGKLKAAVGLVGGSLQLAQWDKEAADAAAANVLAEHAIFRAPAGLTVKAVKYVPDAVLTANDATYATITVQRRAADGTGNVTVASQTTKITGGSGDWLAFQAVALPLTVADIVLAAGQILTVEILKASTGVVVPAGQLVIEYVLN